VGRDSLSRAFGARRRGKLGLAFLGSVREFGMPFSAGTRTARFGISVARRFAALALGDTSPREFWRAALCAA
jgi:hypothetical protein